MTPIVVAIPFPPRNLRKTGQLCPTMAATPVAITTWDRTVPAIRDVLRSEALIPASPTKPILKWPFIDYFDHVFVEKRYVTYHNTEYAQGPEGVAYIQCFIKTT